MKIIRMHDNIFTTIDQFAEYYDLNMVVAFSCWCGRYSAHFETFFTLDNDALVHTFGHGDSEEEAIADYVRRITGETLINAAGKRIKFPGISKTFERRYNMKIIRVHDNIFTTIEQFAEYYDLTMKIVYDCQSGRYSARFRDLYVSNGIRITYINGRGNSEVEAIENYTKKITGLTLKDDTGRRIRFPGISKTYRELT